MSNDTKRPPRWRRIGKVAHAFLLYYTVGFWFYLFFTLPYRWSGKLVVHGQERYEAALRRGRVLIVSNHPAVVESYFLSVLLAQSFWKAIPELWPYSLPDPASFLPRWLWWIFPLIRCVTVQRRDAVSRKQALLRSIELLAEGECLVIHPEGGRTNKGAWFVHGPHNRRLRMPLEQGVATIILSTKDIVVLPVWVDLHGGVCTDVLPYHTALRRGLTITVGDPFQVSSSQRGREARVMVLHKVSLELLYCREQKPSVE